MAEVPPEVVRELLGSAVLLPRALHVERLVVEQEDAAGRVALGVPERVHVDAVRAAVARVRAAVAGLARHFDGLDCFGDGADLIQLDENGVGDALLDAASKNLRVGDENVVADKLNFLL